MKLDIVYEDNHLIAVNKLPGQLSQGDQTGDTPLGEFVKQYLKEKYSKPGNVFLGVIHRLDRPVSGVILFARTTKALERMTKKFRENQVQKTYWAIVAKIPEQHNATLRHFLKRETRKNITKALDKPLAGTKEAVLQYAVKRAIKKFALLEIQPQTGRQHQIRAQLAKIGCPIVGDVKYSYPHANPDASICLHAHKLNFIHPVQKVPTSIEAKPPNTGVWKNFR